MQHLNASEGTCAAANAAAPVAALDAVRVVYGPTVAVDGLSLDIRAGETIGLVGANGAGKSTLMRVIGGASRPTAGRLSLDGQPVDPAAYGPRAAHDAGIRTVWQELSLCQNLTVAENYFIEQTGAGSRRRGPGWRRGFADTARQSIADVFPDSPIHCDRVVGSLPIGQRQMVEIARAASAPGLRLLILDEPTSSLDAERSRQLRDHIRARAAQGLAVIFISHKLAEVLDVADRVFVMRNGASALDLPAHQVGPDRLVAAMGGDSVHPSADRSLRPAPRDVLARITAPAADSPIDLRAGEIVGIAGLEGEGQKDLLRHLHHNRGPVSRNTPAAYISGDRADEGVFPLWSVLENISIGRIARRHGASVVSNSTERRAAEPAAAALDLDTDRFGSDILDLSGGNQQKALAARALTTDAPILILDDPTRGVDIGTKQKFYDTARQAAAAGKLVVYHTTEDAEFAVCDRVLVLGGGRVAEELGPDRTSEERILEAAFAARDTAERAARTGPGPVAFVMRKALENAAILGLIVVCLTLYARNPMVASVFGLELLLGPAVALTMIALAQMFIVGGSEIDLGVGAFAGLVNVLSATLLVASPALGTLALIGGLAGYGAMAALIRLRAIPAIVVTLGASFVWYGVGYSIQPAPGGTAPDWLRAMTQWTVPGVPTPLVLIAVPVAIAWAIHRSRAGTVLRGFGANPMAMQRSGWSALRFAILRYVIAGGFAACGGLTITAMNGASDVNAGSGYTLLAVAAVVLGGCRLLGGVISPLGVAAGALTLSLIGALLGSLGVSTDFNAAVQGSLMILILGLRRLIDDTETGR